MKPMLVVEPIAVEHITGSHLQRGGAGEKHRRRNGDG
jgi:hypothetical protein